MDGTLGIEHNREALKRILAMLIAMAGLALGPHPEVRAAGEPRKTLPRHLHRAILRLLRPAEAAVRRLVIALSRGMMPALPKMRERRPSRAVVGTPARSICLPMFDPLSRNPFRGRTAVAGSLPRISVPGITLRQWLPPRPPCRPDDPLDATRLSLRLVALGRALENLPARARRFALWRARRRGKPVGRLWPLRLGMKPPGRRHELGAVYAHSHALALYALDGPDTS